MSVESMQAATLALLAVIAVVRRERWPRGADLARVTGVGVLFFGVQFAALYYGMSVGVPASTTALVACSAPLVVAAVSARLGWETLTRRQWQGVGLGLAGVVLTLADRVGRPPHLVDLGWTLVGLTGLPCLQPRGPPDRVSSRLRDARHPSIRLSPPRSRARHRETSAAFIAAPRRAA